MRRPVPKRRPVLRVVKTPADPDIPVPVFRGEFGLKIRYHVPHVYALGPRIVEIEEGEEALYPLAREWRIVPRALDDSRHGGPGRYPREVRFQPVPHVVQGVAADVVICPRWRRYGAAKNWRYWPSIANWLRMDGYRVFAAGAPDSSGISGMGGCACAWEFDRFLDASIEALRSCRLCIATDAGLAHLAVLCGTPLLLITYRGLVAPGPVIASNGRIAEHEYWPCKLQEYYHSANHMNAPIVTVDGWEHPERVRQTAREMMACS